MISRLSVEFTSGLQLDFEIPEALARVLEKVKAGTPVVARDVKDGSRAVLGASYNAYRR